MWLFTDFGFFSTVQKHAQDDFLTVRARAATDLDQLRDRYLPELSDTIVGGGSDYPYRATVGHAEFARALAEIAEGISYSNFKSQVHKTLGSDRAHGLMDVWKAMLHVPQSSSSATSAPSVKASAFGGVVFNDAGKLMLREPTNHYGGYWWTFAKGRPNAGESPQEAALREVAEELGVEAEIVEPLPEIFRGDTSDTQFFLMRYVRTVGDPHEETAQTRWVSFSEARELVMQSKTKTGRQRDLRVLDSAEKALARRES